ncbi:5-oxoprolinase subunit PxpB [Planococcus sp. S3-L1]|uniref:5-oxoprolinase subunit PxpB n=1 Tax=Planococcus sp. S3-L1 TaxID=3046200 RepID=UPI0024BADE88|nr:5-oxoprolinase subunit PxpB [Planococcus sp. S3-L1]MDJ0331354.1 5-oxoprolinase subunit PxpB [Planococcus sp. S3-L1]
MNISFSPLGDQAIVIEFGHEINKQTEQAVRRVSTLLEKQKPDWMIEFIPAFVTVTVFYNPILALYDKVKIELERLLSHLGEDLAVKTTTIEIPVCYGGEFGPDLEFVARHNKLTPREVIDIHTSGTYSVHMIGFAPGFPFIGGMSEKIAAPRRDSPRLRIPERTVGIAGMQTGVYPIETPGGWQLIGRTPIRLFLPENDVPSLLRAGDQIVFKEISKEDYDAWEEKPDAENP